jgi:hypothetical protein
LRVATSSTTRADFARAACDLRAADFFLVIAMVYSS